MNDICECCDRPIRVTETRCVECRGYDPDVTRAAADAEYDQAMAEAARVEEVVE